MRASGATNIEHRISVVIPTLNAVTFIETAIRSVLGQGYDGLELVVADGGSTDGTLEVLARYRKSIDCLIVREDAGPGHAFNRAVEECNGDVVVALNADDLLLSGALRTIANVMFTQTDIALLQGRAIMIDGQGAPVGLAIPDPFHLERYAYGATRIVHPGSAVRRQWFNRVGGFNTSNRTCWDGELFVDIATAGGRIDSRKDWLACYRVHPSAISSSDGFMRLYMSDRRRIARSIVGTRSSSWAYTAWSLGLRIASVLREPLNLFRRIPAVIRYYSVPHSRWIASMHEKGRGCI